jgi:uncharacterized protein (UPF0261 family)
MEPQNRKQIKAEEKMNYKPVVLIGALDTKGLEYKYVRDLITQRGLETIVIDFGVLGKPPFDPDINAAEVALAGGSSLDELRKSQDKSRAMRIMREGLVRIVTELYQEGRLGGVLGMAGSGGTSLVTAAMRGLPVGTPKVMVSTVAGGDVSQYVGTKDITMMPSIVDVAGLNSISRTIYANAAGAIAGMVEMDSPQQKEEKPLITASMFGNTTKAVDHARSLLEDQGYEVLVFHASGSGGRTMESLIESGFITANLDLTTTELADEVCGGIFSAGPDRLLAAARAGIPTVIAPGCIDMANFWGIDTVPEKYKDRNLYEWNPNVTLMRTNVEENKTIGKMITNAANQSNGPVSILLPLKGVSQLDSPGGEFWYPEANQACFNTIKVNLKPGIEVIELDNNINDPEFSNKAVEVLTQMLKS